MNRARIGFIVLLVLFAAGPVAADYRQNGTTGTWFLRAAVGSERQIALSEAESCLERIATAPVVPRAFRVATLQYATQTGVAELSLTWPRALALQLVEEWAPAGGWTAGSPHPKAQHASRALARHLRLLLGICRSLPPPPPPDPPELEDPLP